MRVIYSSGLARCSKEYGEVLGHFALADIQQDPSAHRCQGRSLRRRALPMEDCVVAYSSVGAGTPVRMLSLGAGTPVRMLSLGSGSLPLEPEQPAMDRASAAAATPPRIRFMASPCLKRATTSRTRGLKRASSTDGDGERELHRAAEVGLAVARHRARATGAFVGARSADDTNRAIEGGVGGAWGVRGGCPSVDRE